MFAIAQMQLLDEMPMHWLVMYASATLYTRNAGNGTWRKTLLYTATTLFCSTLDVIVWTTDKRSDFHQATHLLMAISFLIAFIYLFYVMSKSANQIYERDPGNVHHRRTQRYFDKSFAAFTVALVGWLCDNLYCELLQNLSVIPYLQYHAVLWHCGTCVGLHYFFMVMLAHRVIFQYGGKIQCTTICCGLLPFISVQPKAD